jgi:hypothetical protein
LPTLSEVCFWKSLRQAATREQDGAIALISHFINRRVTKAIAPATFARNSEMIILGFNIDVCPEAALFHEALLQLMQHGDIARQ